MTIRLGLQAGDRVIWATARHFLLPMLLALGLGATSNAWAVKESSAASSPTMAKVTGSKSAPLFIEGVVTSKKDIAESEEDKREKAEKSQLEKTLAKYAFWTLVFAGLMFIVGTLQAGFFVWQLILIQQSTKDAGTAALAARDSADAAKNTAIAMATSERAYIFADVKINSNTTMDPLFAIAKMVADVQYWNYGKTPALITSLRQDIYASTFAPQELLPAFAAELPPAIAIGPDKDFPYQVVKKFSKGEFLDLQHLNSQLFVVGELRYETVHGQKCVTSYCWVVTHVNDAWQAVPSRESKLNHRS